MNDKEFTTKQHVEIKIDIQKATAQILEDNGELYQKIKAIEELSELIDAISKDVLFNLDGLKPSFSKINVIEEMADVQISLSNLSHIYGDPSEQIQYKLNRYFERKALKESKHTPWGTRDEKLSGDIIKETFPHFNKQELLQMEKDCGKVENKQSPAIKEGLTRFSNLPYKEGFKECVVCGFHIDDGASIDKKFGTCQACTPDNTHKPTPLDTKKPCLKCGISARLTYVNQDNKLCDKCNPLSGYSARLNP